MLRSHSRPALLNNATKGNMKPKTGTQSAYSRRDILKLAGLATASLAGTATLLKAQETVRRGSAPVKLPT